MQTDNPTPEATMDLLRQFVSYEKSIMADIETAHQRGPGASHAMRLDDREMRTELRKLFAVARETVAKADVPPTVAPDEREDDVWSREDEFAYRQWMADGGETEQFRHDPRIVVFQNRFNRESRGEE